MLCLFVREEDCTRGEWRGLPCFAQNGMELNGGGCRLLIGVRWK